MRSDFFLLLDLSTNRVNQSKFSLYFVLTGADLWTR